ncbi:MAG: GNAT family N-acetyltransferase [Promethearchaeota archaeon]|jgi:ribosomal protein S18 acetylase RimI-like enzyme
MTRIIQIYNKDYPKNKKVVLEYTSKYYYKLKAKKKVNNEGWIFEWRKTSFNETFRKKWEGNLFEAFKGEAEYYILENIKKEEIGILAFEHLSHSNRTRIWDIYIQSNHRRNGFGTLLLNYVQTKAKNLKSRALVLECQNTNYKAINFYLKNGFKLIGFDLEAYTQEQGGGIEVRFEMGKNL